MEDELRITAGPIRGECTAVRQRGLLYAVAGHESQQQFGLTFPRVCSTELPAISSCKCCKDKLSKIQVQCRSMSDWFLLTFYIQTATHHFSQQPVTQQGLPQFGALTLPTLDLAAAYGSCCGSAVHVAPVLSLKPCNDLDESS